ncbi:MAG: SMC-Scp complex subunit ScpB, partial [Candidatus Nanohaloarchaea archaeon]|nr:SMC-Scp complex subunit ScpB [Candidatus Nanohaloarchaea archaeon]
HIDQVRDLAPHQDLSDAALRTLSIIAYNAPVKQSKIIDIRGNRAYSQISDLEERGLLSSSKDGRTKVLDVTEDFLDYFGIDDLDEFRDGLDAAPAAEMLLDDEETDDAADEEEAAEETADDEEDQAAVDEQAETGEPDGATDTGTDSDTAGGGSDGDLLTTDGQLQ